MTPYGYMIVGAVVFAIILGVGVTRKMKKPSISVGIYITLVLACLSLLGAVSAQLFFKTLHAHLTMPAYTATIVGHEEYWSEDSDGNRTKWFRPTIRFTAADGDTITAPNPTSYGRKPVRGDTVTVRYEDGDLQQPALWLYMATGLFAVVFGYLLLCALFFAAGRPTKRLGRLGINVLLKGVIPAGLLFMGGAIMLGSLSYWFGSNSANLSFGLSIVTFLFGAAILLALLGYMKMVFQKRHSPK